MADWQGLFEWSLKYKNIKAQKQKTEDYLLLKE